MNSIDLSVLNLGEVRRRSKIVWSGIPKDFLNWRPDSEALTCIEMIRHVLDSEHFNHLAINNKGSISIYVSPFESLPLVSVEKELEIAKPLREDSWRK